ncbi:MAG: Npt1/Npt2 family nucleotide transporter [bacterium]
MKILQKIKVFLWGDISKEEMERFGMLALTFMLIIGAYWLLRPLKDGVFMSVVGRDFLPYAKIISLCWIFPLVLIYSKLVDLVEKQKLFYIICGSYATLFTVVAYLLTHPTIGLANTVPSPKRALGWVFYLAVESFGSLLIALFWSFVASNTKTESAKRGYGIIIFGAQIGSMIGPMLAINADYFGLPLLTLMVAIALCLVPVLIKIFISLFPGTAETDVSKQKKTGSTEGLKLIATRPYLLGILGVSTLYEVVATILDLKFKMLVGDTFSTAAQATSFLGYFGFATNLLTFIFTFVGTSFVIRKMGLTFCLVAYPALAAALVLFAWLYPVLSVLFGCMMAYKAMSYALNNPCKEIMYIPTSKDVKFKAKGWIDMFGSRTAKGLGSGIQALALKTSNVIAYGSILSLGVVAIWLTAAIYVGRKNKTLVESGQILQ